jgi:hypothetical protein
MMSKERAKKRKGKARERDGKEIRNSKRRTNADLIQQESS